MTSSRTIQPDTHELILCSDKAHACETYLFEPGPDEKSLGHLFAAAGTDDREGVGSELLDTIITAIQREYYRDPNRSPAASFEMALHQANLILHDMSEQGMREWMPSFRAVVAVLVDNELHLSVAGIAQALLVRKGIVSDISTGLAQIPITNPLQTFSQVATGEIHPRDVMFLGTNSFSSLFADTELVRTVTEQSAEQMGLRLGQRYEDLGRTNPLASIIISALPQYTAATSAATQAPLSNRTSRGVNPTNLAPREPLIVNRGNIQKVALVVAQSARAIGAFTAQKIWPLVKTGSSRSGRAIAQASKATGRNIQNIAANRTSSAISVREMPRVFVRKIISFLATLHIRYGRLPKSSKIFALISLILVITLGASVLLLQHKRATDTEIQHASESLQDARTKVDAAKTALIYDNRNQAEGLLNDAKNTANSLISQNVYTNESKSLLQEIEKQFDRLQRVTRISSDDTTVVGDFGNTLKTKPIKLFSIGDTFYTFDPSNDAIVSMGSDGTPSIAHQTTQGIGFFTAGKVQTADKTITLLTDSPGIALFDSKDSSLSGQDITFPSDKPDIKDIAIFGNRLYVLDKNASNIFSYNKTLRGYSSGSPWIQEPNFPISSIISFAIDSSVYTLHSDGSIHKLFKGKTADFTAESVNPQISDSAHIITSDEISNIYVVDPKTKRIIIYNKSGQLLKQILVDAADNFADAAISTDETKAYVLDGTRVLEVSLAD